MLTSNFRKVPQLGAAESRSLQRNVWGEIIESLEKDVPEVRDVLESLQRRQDHI